MKLICAFIMIFSLFSNCLTADALSIGSAAPKITTTTDKGEVIDLGSELSSGTALIFFYPKAMTPGCTKQACSLRDSWDELQDKEIKVFGVSSDTAETQAEFKDKYTLPFTLIADTDNTVSKAFGKGRWSRQAYLFKDGILVWRDLSAATAKQAAEVIAAIQALEK